MNTIWSFDLGKASIGEAVRDKDSATFAHKASLLIPQDLARRGPATMSGTPASRYRMLQTRKAHDRREAWLETIWRAAGLEPLQRRTVDLVAFKMKKVKKRSNGKARWTHKKVGGQWKLTVKGDPKLEQEFGVVDGDLAGPSCVLRIRLLQGEALKPWQIYKALFSAIQKRGYGDVPWKEQRKGGDDKTPNAQEEAENAIADQRWKDFVRAVKEAGLDETYLRACYFDAWHMKLWNPATPMVTHLQPTERPESTRKVVFPAHVIIEEVLALAAVAAEKLPALPAAYAKFMADWRSSVEERIAKVNAHRATLGKKLMRVPDFSRGAKDFAEMLAFGPGGRVETPARIRPIASYDPVIRKATGLRPGGPDDAMGALNQEVARFDNRLRADCALISRLSVCRNLSDAELKAIKEDDHENLLPAQTTFLMKVKNMRVEEKNAERTQRGLKAHEIKEIFAALNPERKYHLTKREWRNWCAKLAVLPVTDPDEKVKGKRKETEVEDVEKKKNDEFAVERPRTDGRGRFSRPALRIMKELLLSGDAPALLHGKLTRGELVLKVKTGHEREKTLAIFADGSDAAANRDNAKRGLLVSDLEFLLRMGKDGKAADSWDDLYIPSQQLDRLAQEAESTPQQRAAAIRALIGKQNNPIVRHRLETLWKRLRTLEEKFGTPYRIVLEFVRDDSETSWLGPEAAGEITRAQKEQRERRDRAKERLVEMGQSNGDVLKFLLWEAQGSQCLYTGNALKFSDLENYRVDHIVPRAKGGPDAFSNLIITTDEANAAKGDRTPWQWFRQDRTLAEWDAYKTRVLNRTNQLGWKKTRLLLDAEAEKLVERYQPLAETAWIARLAQTIAGLHFGWVNGKEKVPDGKGGTKWEERVIVVSGGLTGRVRRKYFLNTLLGRSRELDQEIERTLAALADLKTSPLPREQRKAKARVLRGRLDELGALAEAQKDRRDKRHHAVDAMVLSFLEGWVNDPNREDEFRFTLLGDNPTFGDDPHNELGKLRSQIIALGAAADKVRTPEERTEIQRKITACHDAIAHRRQPRNERAVREAFRREIEGDSAAGIEPILPRHLHLPKPELEATFHRGVWLRAESESRAARATIDNFSEAFEQERVPLGELPYLINHRKEEREYSAAHGLRRIAEIVAHKDYDKNAVRGAVAAFLQSHPTEDQWKSWSASAGAPAGVKPKKGQPDLREIVLYRIEEKRTKRETLYDLGVGSNEVPDYDRVRFELQVARLVRKPERTAKAGEPLQPDTELQEKLRTLQPQIEAFYAEYPPDPGNRPRKESARAAWQLKKDRAKDAWKEFAKQNGLDRYKKVYLRTDSDKITDRRYENPFLSSVLLTNVKRFDLEGV
jgi:CRISPR-associated endonuclease Csn1